MCEIFAQRPVFGVVQSLNSGQGIPFVSIGIPGTTVGTVSDEAGYFTLVLPLTSINKDSLIFQVIGFRKFTISLNRLDTVGKNTIHLETEGIALEEVVVKPRKAKYKHLGNTKYSRRNCTGFTDINRNWKGSETAVLFRNKKPAFLEYFAFYIIQNKYKDSLCFRLKFYSRTKKDWVGPMLNHAVIFKVGPGNGEIKISLSEYKILLKEDFFISLECLMEEMDISKFCYSSSLHIPSYYKVKAFSKWHSTRGTQNGGGGADFNVMVAYRD